VKNYIGRIFLISLVFVFFANISISVPTEYSILTKETIDRIQWAPLSGGKNNPWIEADKDDLELLPGILLGAWKIKASNNTNAVAYIGFDAVSSIPQPGSIVRNMNITLQRSEVGRIENHEIIYIDKHAGDQVTLVSNRGTGNYIMPPEDATKGIPTKGIMNFIVLERDEVTKKYPILIVGFFAPRSDYGNLMKNFDAFLSKITIGPVAQIPPVVVKDTTITESFIPESFVQVEDTVIQEKEDEIVTIINNERTVSGEAKIDEYINSMQTNQPDGIFESEYSVAGWLKEHVNDVFASVLLGLVGFAIICLIVFNTITLITLKNESQYEKKSRNVCEENLKFIIMQLKQLNAMLNGDQKYVSKCKDKEPTAIKEDDQTSF
jgi:hypothetical protein